MAEKKEKPKMLRVRALRMGFYLNRRRPGDVFMIPADEDGKAPSWCEVVDTKNEPVETKKEETPAAGAKGSSASVL